MKLTQQFYHTLDEYTASNSHLKTLLTSVLDTLEDGRIPSHSDITKVSSLSSLFQQYKQLYQIAQKILGSEETPERGCSVFTLKTLIEEREKKISEQVQAVEANLHTFLAVKATHEEYIEALQPFMTKAKELIQEIEEDSFVLEKLVNEAGPHELFLKAMAHSAMEQGERENLFSRIDDIFPAKVSRPLFREGIFSLDPSILETKYCTHLLSIYKVALQTRSTAGIPLNDAEQKFLLRLAEKPEEIATSTVTPETSVQENLAREEQTESPIEEDEEYKVPCPANSKNTVRTHMQFFEKKDKDIHYIYLRFIFLYFKIVEQNQIYTILQILIKKYYDKSYTNKVLKNVLQIKFITKINNENIYFCRYGLQDISYEQRLFSFHTFGIFNTIYKSQINESILIINKFIEYIKYTEFYNIYCIKNPFDIYTIYKDNHENNSTEAKIKYNNNDIMCTIILKKADIESISSSSYLYILTPEENLPSIDSSENKAEFFAIQKTRLFHWEGIWQAIPTQEESASTANSFPSLVEESQCTNSVGEKPSPLVLPEESSKETQKNDDNQKVNSDEIQSSLDKTPEFSSLTAKTDRPQEASSGESPSSLNETVENLNSTSKINDAQLSSAHEIQPAVETSIEKSNSNTTIDSTQKVASDETASSSVSTIKESSSIEKNDLIQDSSPNENTSSVETRPENSSETAKIDTTQEVAPTKSQQSTDTSEKKTRKSSRNKKTSSDASAQKKTSREKAKVLDSLASLRQVSVEKTKVSEKKKNLTEDTQTPTREEVPTATKSKKTDSTKRSSSKSKRSPSNSIGDLHALSLLTLDTKESKRPDETLAPVKSTSKKQDSASQERELPSKKPKSITFSQKVGENLPQTPEEKTKEGEELPLPPVTPVENILSVPPLHEEAEEKLSLELNEEVTSLAQKLLDATDFPSEEDVNTLIKLLLSQCAFSQGNGIADSALVSALLLAKTALPSSSTGEYPLLYEKILLASALPLNPLEYSGYKLSTLFPLQKEEWNSEDESLMLSAYMYATFRPHLRHDYLLHTTANDLLQRFENIFPSYTLLKPLFHSLCSIDALEAGGFSVPLLFALKGKDKKAASMNYLQQEANSFKTEPKIYLKMRGIPALSSECFGPKSDLYLCMDIIEKDGNAEDQAIVKELLKIYATEENDSFIIHRERIEKHIDNTWSQLLREKTFKRYDLLGPPREQFIEAFLSRLELIKRWLEAKRLEAGSSLNAKQFKALSSLKETIINQCNEALQKFSDCDDVLYSGIVASMLARIKYSLETPGARSIVFADLLRTGIISLDRHCLPILDETRNAISYSEPWRLVLRHIVQPKLPFKKAEKAINNIESISYDNLRQLELLWAVQGKQDKITEEQYSESLHYAEENKKNFKERLELAYTYGRINETDKEELAQVMEGYWDSFAELGDFGCWKQFLNDLDQNLTIKTEERRAFLMEDIVTREKKNPQNEKRSILKKAERLLCEDQNFAVAEEYIHRYDLGAKDFSEELQSVFEEEDSFAEFLSDKVFSPLYEFCNARCGRQPFKRYGLEYLERNWPEEWTSRTKESAKKLITNWPSSANVTNEDSIEELFLSIGFAVTKATKVRDSKTEQFRLHIIPTKRGLPDYRHPIAVFGTQTQSPIPLILLYGSRQPKELVDTLNSINTGCMSIVILDYALDRITRRQISEFCRQSSGLNPFIVIDQVLALHLALHQETERVPVMLKCTLPFSTSIQPFVRDSGPTADEMFCGRTRELASIIDPNGACLVYGGRQLGKTALLQRAESRVHKPDDKNYALFCTSKTQKTEESFALFLSEEISRKTQLNFPQCNSLKEIADALFALFQAEKISRFLLLIDEADDLLRSMSEKQYASLACFVDLKRETYNGFKFVLAGVNNVCRAKNATANNGVIGQLGTPLCIKPLSPTDALRLLLRPLRYLGFKVTPDVRFETILTNTNFYPGILQFFGYTLVESLKSEEGAHYSAAMGNPPFELQNQQLGAIMNSSDLNFSIKKKFQLSLELDPRYYMLARCIGMLHLLYGRDAHRRFGYTVAEIIEIAKNYNISCLKEEDKESFSVLLDEMTDMGILSSPSAGIYRICRQNFLDIIGRDMDKLEEEILEAEEEQK